MSLPNVLCIGATKSGTTSLYDILSQHTEVFTTSFKEPHFFDIDSVYKNGLDWYRKTYFSSVKNQKIITDFTPTYLFEKKAVNRIYNDLGKNVKFIIMLRNPVERAYSHYLHSKRDMHDKSSFKEALVKEEGRLLKDDYLSVLRFSYVNQGLYYKMLNPYLQFFPTENFLIINFEQDFLKDRERTMEKIFSFLDISHQNININIRSNPASKPRIVFFKEFMKREGLWRNILKNIIPSLRVRQIIKNNLQRLNITEYTPKDLSPIDKIAIFEKYFKDDVEELEKLIERKMNWN